MNKPIVIGVLSASLAGTVMGCAEEPFSVERGRERIAFTVADGSLADGDTIIATLVNRSDQVMGYNLCLAELERRIGSQWQKIPRHEKSFCPLVVLPLGPGESDSLRQPVRDEFPTGVYRFRAEVVWPIEDNQRFAVTSASFTME